MTALSAIDLPADYSTANFIAYHLRDPAQISERWHDGVLYKALSWNGKAACLALTFTDTQVTAHFDCDHSDIDRAALDAMLRKMLGLDQDIVNFERAAVRHPQLGPLVQQQRGLRVPASATPFEALVWAIVGQQISVQAAISIRRRLVQAVGTRHSTGLWSHPDAHTVATTSPDTLRNAGLSAAKVRTLLAASQAIVQGELCLSDPIDTLAAQKLQDQLTSIRGIGPWTADYTLLRGYGWLDGSLHGDAAVRRSLRAILQQETPVSADYTREWLTEFSPWRALAAAHLWAALKLQT